MDFNWDMITPELKANITIMEQEILHDYPVPSERFAYGNGTLCCDEIMVNQYFMAMILSRGYNTWDFKISKSLAYVTTDNLSKDNVSWQVTDNSSMIFKCSICLNESRELKHILHDGNRYLGFR